MIGLFNPHDTLINSLKEFQDRVKQKSESYSQYYKDLNRLAELCKFRHKSEFLKYKLFQVARSEQFFAKNLADFNYEGRSVSDFLTQLQNLEVAYKNSLNICC